MILLIDNYDSFTFNLQDYFVQLGADCNVKRNDEVTIADIRELQPQAIVLSPGPKRPEDAGITMQLIQAFHASLPILGICLGHQAIGLFFGATLKKADRPMHGKISKLFHDGKGVFQHFEQGFEVMHYHSLVLGKNVPVKLETHAWTNQGEVMAIKHVDLPIWGFQFHPESILTNNGLQLLNQWLSLYVYNKEPTNLQIR